MFREAIKDQPHVEVHALDGLTVDFARSRMPTVLIRSMRGSTDFEYEFDMALMNRKMAPEIESRVPDLEAGEPLSSAARASARSRPSATMSPNWCRRTSPRR